MSEQASPKTSLLYKLKKFIGTPQGTALAVLFWSVFITGVVYLITTTRILRVGWRIVQAPTMLLLNILPVLLLILLLLFLTRKLFFSVSVTGVLFIFFAIVDRVKVSMRQEPLLPTDLTLVKETLAIVKTFPVYQIVLIGLLIAAFVVLLILSFRKSKGMKISTAPRIVGLVLVIACAFGANQFWYADKTLYDGYPSCISSISPRWKPPKAMMQPISQKRK